MSIPFFWGLFRSLSVLLEHLPSLFCCQVFHTERQLTVDCIIGLRQNWISGHAKPAEWRLFPSSFEVQTFNLSTRRGDETRQTPIHARIRTEQGNGHQDSPSALRAQKPATLQHCCSTCTVCPKPSQNMTEIVIQDLNIPTNPLFTFSQLQHRTQLETSRSHWYL